MKHQRFGQYGAVLSADTPAARLAYDAIVDLPPALQNYLAEPAAEGVPVRVWRDWALITVALVVAVLETVLRNDEEWLSVSPAWRLVSLVVFMVSVIPALLIRRTRPLIACALAFGVSVAFGLVLAQVEGEFGGLYTTIVILITPYALARWASGRDTAIGLLIILVAGVSGNVGDPATTAEDWIGSFIVLIIPVLIGLIVRYQRSARGRAISEAKSLERAELARELHDTVAHHVSAIAVQAQAGRALAATDPQRALGVLALIEEAASRTLVDMRSMVGTLRDGSEPDLAPQHGLQDLRNLATEADTGQPVTVSIDHTVGVVAPAIESALFRIARESVTNSIRHARGATMIAVQVAGAADIITLTITDNGDPVPARRGGAGSYGMGFGLLGMAERAELLGGSFRAGPGPERGWQVLVELPRGGANS